MTVVHHLLDVYGVDLYLLTNRRDWATLRRRFTSLGDAPTSDGATQLGHFVPDQGGRVEACSIIWISGLVSDDLDLVEVCAHEASHAAGQILHWAGHDFRGDEGGDEPHAFLVGWLTRWLWQHTRGRQA